MLFEVDLFACCSFFFNGHSFPLLFPPLPFRETLSPRENSPFVSSLTLSRRGLFSHTFCPRSAMKSFLLSHRIAAPMAVPLNPLYRLALFFPAHSLDFRAVLGFFFFVPILLGPLLGRQLFFPHPRSQEMAAGIYGDFLAFFPCPFCSDPGAPLFFFFLRFFFPEYINASNRFWPRFLLFFFFLFFCGAVMLLPWFVTPPNGFPLYWRWLPSFSLALLRPFHPFLPLGDEFFFFLTPPTVFSCCFL